MNHSPQQLDALTKIDVWLRLRRTPENQVFRLFGYAGTGKTTLAKHIADKVRGGVVFAAFTGKASLVMSRKGCNPSSTIHKLIYKPFEDPITGDFKFKLRHINESQLSECALIIIDECSMVDEKIGADLLSYGVPVLVLGDPAQLPPVSGAGFFTENVVPDVMLTEIHRQAQGNPIIALATLAREAQCLPDGVVRSDTGVTSVCEEVADSSLLAADQVICGTNSTRKALNSRMRRLLGEQGKLRISKTTWHQPVIDDRVICLRNRHDRGIMNGSLWKVTALSDRALNARKVGRPDVAYMTLQSDDDPAIHVHANVPLRFFSTDSAIKQKLERDERDLDEFDFGYAITCHKAQGSQWSKVVVYDQGGVFREDAHRWTYTAITRAADKLIVVQQ